MAEMCDGSTIGYRQTTVADEMFSVDPDSILYRWRNKIAPHGELDTCWTSTLVALLKALRDPGPDGWRSTVLAHRAIATKRVITSVSCQSAARACPPYEHPTETLF